MAELVTVYALKDHLKKVLKHPEGGYPMNEDGSARWPHDNWTKRRIRDGDLSLENPNPTPPSEPPPEGQAQTTEQPASTVRRTTRTTAEPKPTE